MIGVHDPTDGRDLLGHVALVTGADRGIGAATVRALAARGATVIASDRLPVDADIAPEHCSARLVLDVTSEKHWVRVVDEVTSTFGGLHVLVNNAGLARAEDVEAESDAGWVRVMDVNLRGAWLGMQAAGAQIERGGGGAIVNVASILAVTGGFGDSAAYHASKGGVVSLTRNAAVHWGRSGVRVNAVLPGFIGTESLRKGLEGSGRLEAIEQRTPLGRVGSAEEAAAAIAFLASPAASFVTGATLTVDGGMTIA